MRAAVYQGNQQFAIKDLADPAPAPGQVVVDVEFCAICGTDVHAVMYDIAPVGSVLGHEYEEEERFLREYCEADVESMFEVAYASEQLLFTRSERRERRRVRS